MALFQAKHFWIKQLGDGVAVLMLDREGGQFNFIDPPLLDDLDRALDAVAAADGIRLLVIHSAKTANFCHGPSAAHLSSWTRADYASWAERGQQVCSKLAELPMPSACVIAGTCFDAGLELALACDYRVVVNLPSTSLGFPKLVWGMIPCWGGTQRLPRLVGLEQSLRMLLAGERVEAREAWVCNLADHLAEDVEEEPPAFLENPVKRDWSVLPSSSWRQRWLESNRLGRWFLFRGAERILRTRIPEEQPAPVEMLRAIRHAFHLPTVAAGLEFERQAVARVVEHPAVHHLLRLLEHRDMLRLPSLNSSNKDRIVQVGVVGGGTAALSLLLHSVVQGYEVVLHAEDEEALGTALTQIVQLLQIEVQRGAMTTSQFQKTLSSIRGTYTWTHFDKLHMVLDTTSGTLEDRRKFYQGMEAKIPASALVVPISPLHPIEDLRRGLQHPERVIGLHLIEPWNRGTVAEIVAPAGAAQPSAQRVREWAVGLGKCCLQTPDRVGGIVMRVWLPALNEAALLVKEGVRIDRIDQAMRRFGMTYGPLEWMDRLGIDHIAALVAAMQPIFAGRITFQTGFALMAEKGWLGKRTGLGFYCPGWKEPKPHQESAMLWKTQSQGEATRPVPTLSEADAHAWIQNRLVTLMVLEAVRCLDEGLLKDADDLDCALCLTGWATHRGGPIGYARQIDAEVIVRRCTELSQQYGMRFAPFAALNQFLAK